MKFFNKPEGKILAKFDARNISMTGEDSRDYKIPKDFPYFLSI